MYALKNKVQLIGNLGGKPELKNTESGKKLAQFSIATSESYRNVKGEKVTETQWHRVIAWGKLAEIAEKYLDKGKEVAIEGKLINRSYSDKEGNKFNPADMGMPPGIPMNVPHVVTFHALSDNKTEITVTESGYTLEQVVDLSRQGLEQCLDKMAASFL